jgi:polyisoprenyl-teichoic acid--peptidoglycan teichoic acid transferase
MRSCRAGGKRRRSSSNRARYCVIHRPLRTNRHVAALLSALWPGLGQLAVGARRTGVLLGLPPLILVTLVIAALASPDRLERLALLLDPNVIAAVLLLEGALLAWRLMAVADAFRRGQGRARERGAALTGVALVFVLVPSVYAAYLTNVAREAALEVFKPAEQAWQPGPFQPTYHDEDFGEQPIESTGPLPTPELGRFTVLLLGVDSGPGRSEFLTDTMIVASLDPIAGAVSMVSVPRDMVDVPLPDGRVFHPKINSLVSYANQYPKKFPSATSGEAVLAAALGKLLNVRVDGWAEVNLPGFVKVIDSIGGVDVTVRNALCDPRYDEYGFNGFAINPGKYHLDGEGALAYARIRKSYGENDFTRAARQGEIVVAARDRVVKGGFLNDPAGFIEAMGKLLTTSLDPATIGKYVEYAASIQRDHVYRAVITYPLVHGSRNDPRGSVLIPRMSLIRALAAQAFPPAGTLPGNLETIPENDQGPSKTKLPAVTCYAPKPTPAPTLKPTRAPTPPPAPTAEPTAPPPSPEKTPPPPPPS